MVKNRGRYIMRLASYSRYRKRLGVVACVHCGVPIKVGDPYFSKAMGSSKNRNIYCLDCAERLNL